MEKGDAVMSDRGWTYAHMTSQWAMSITSLEYREKSLKEEEDADEYVNYLVQKTVPKALTRCLMKEKTYFDQTRGLKEEANNQI